MKKRIKVSQVALYGILTLISVLWIIPVLFIFSLSVTPETSLSEVGYRLIPKEITFDAYTYIIKNPAQILNSYKISIIVTVIGTVAGLMFTTGIAYAMSRKDFKLGKHITRFVMFAMLFHGGLIPTYIVVTQVLHLGNTLWVLILTMLVSPWNIFLMKSFLSSIPTELLEASFIDGATEYQTFKVVLPLAKPGLATVGLLILFSYWNDWYQAMLYIDNMDLVPLQLLLYKIISNIQFVLQNSFYLASEGGSFPTIAARMATCVIAIAPMLLAFPFFQKYLAKGLTLGSVKG